MLRTWAWVGVGPVEDHEQTRGGDEADRGCPQQGGALAFCQLSWPSFPWLRRVLGSPCSPLQTQFEGGCPRDRKGILLGRGMVRAKVQWGTWTPALSQIVPLLARLTQTPDCPPFPLHRHQLPRNLWTLVSIRARTPFLQGRLKGIWPGSLRCIMSLEAL